MCIWVIGSHSALGILIVAEKDGLTTLIIRTGDEILESLKDFKNDFGRPLGKKKKRNRNDLCEDEEIVHDEYDESSDQWRWKKRSILYELPYWKVHT